ncbi:MAG: hypothetical protein R3C53_06950 [Pirellulaceae bacterium]
MNALIVSDNQSSSTDARCVQKPQSGALIQSNCDCPPVVVHHQAPQVVILQPVPLVIERALNHRGIVLGILLLAGPIGLPALWFSRCFSKPTKIITTVAYIFGTVILPIAAVIYYLEFSLLPLVNAFSQ